MSSIKTWAPDKMGVSISFLILTGLLYFSFFINLSDKPLHIWDEARRANDALQMHLQGDWIIDYYDNNRQTWSFKSPILIWLQAICIKVFGINELAIRFPTALGTSLTGIVIWLFCVRYFSKHWLGFLAGAVFASTYAWVFMHGGRTGDYDGILTLFTTLYTLFFYLYVVNKNNKWFNLFWVFLTLAVLFKGVAGAFFLPGLALFTIMQRQLKTVLTSKNFYVGFFCFAIIIASYYLLREWRAPGFLQAIYGNELGGRYLKALEDNGHSFFYYYYNMRSWRYDYWLYFAIAAFPIGFFVSSSKMRKITLFNFLMVLTFGLIISFSKTKLYWYDLPMYPFLSIQIAVLLFAVMEYIHRWLKSYPVIIQKLIPTLIIILLFYKPFQIVYIHNFQKYNDYQTRPWDIDVEERKQGLFLQQAIKHNTHLDDYTFLYDGPDRQINFYIKKLQAEQVNVRLVNATDSIQPGKPVVVSQEHIVQSLHNQYYLDKLDEKFGCLIFLVKAIK